MYQVTVEVACFEVKLALLVRFDISVEALRIPTTQIAE